MGSFLMAVLAFALVTSVGAGVALQSAGTAPHTNAGLQCGDDHTDKVDHDGTHEVNESREDSETAEHIATAGHLERSEHNETRDLEANETADHGDRDDTEVCEPNETSGSQESMDLDVNEMEDEAST
jgi:hypothetical protein